MSLSNLQSEGELHGFIDANNDVIDYNTLTNKPEINGTTIEGNHEGNYYGLANLNDIINVVANPIDAATQELKKLKVGSVTYKIPETIVYGESSGSIAHFIDGSEVPLKELIIDIDNTGWTEANITRAEKNLAYLTYGDKVPSVATGQMVSSYGWSSDYIKLNKSLNYIATSEYITGVATYILFYAADKSYLGYTLNFTYTGYNLSNSPYWINASYIKFRADAGSSIQNNIQLEIGANATDYEPYNAETYSISWAEHGTISNGKLSIIDGHATVTDGINTYDLGNIDISSHYGENNIWSDTGDIDKCKYIRDLNICINLIINSL